MCGIAGHLNLKKKSDVLAGLSLLHHRGPDEKRVFNDGVCHLGIRRLAIVDLTPGVQPVTSKEGEVVAVMNGEVYNHVELAEGLRASGYSLKSKTDAEVVPHLYEEYGDQFLEKLRGMFALAIWDSKRQRLLLARDRFGKKPLYYRRVGDGVAFASEIKALRAMVPDVEWQVREQGVYDYLSLGVVPQSGTVYEGVAQVPPGSVMVFARGQLEARSYWIPRPGKQTACSEEIREMVQESVRLRLRSDVPVGVFLSGGIDSNVVAYEASRETKGEVETFTVGMSEEGLDESTVARAAAQRYGVRNEVLPLEISPERDLMELVRHYDQPFADSSALACWAVARVAAQRVKVVLTGDGGDELFGGYRRHLAAYRLGQMQVVPRWGWRGLATMLPRRQRRSLLGFARRFARGAGATPGRRYLEWSSDLLLDDDKCTIWQGGEVAATEDWIEAQVEGNASLLRQQMQLDQRVNLLSDLLVKMDMATMAHSLEARSPLLDHELAEYAMGLTDGELIRGGVTKSVLRQAYADVLPVEVLNGKKRGFEVPVERWLETEWRELLQDVLGAQEPAAAAYVDRRFLRDLIADRLEGDWNVPMLKYTMLVLELWLREQKK